MKYTKNHTDNMHSTTEKLKLASQNYKNGYTCSQAVISAYYDEIGLDEKIAYRIFEGFGGGFGGKQEVCGAFSAACAIISFYSSSGSLDGQSKIKTYKIIQDAAQMFENEYYSIRCKEILHGNKPKALQCEMKVKDAILLIEKILKNNNHLKGQNINVRT